MARRMSVAMTVDAVREHRKTVTRRHVNTWKTLKPGDRLTLIEKGMGLKKGEKQVVLAEVEVVDVRVETLGDLTNQEIVAEGFTYANGALVDEWAAWWADSHGYKVKDWEALDEIPCRRIEWVYTNPQPPTEYVRVIATNRISG